jgi:hypothetical protein
MRHLGGVWRGKYCDCFAMRGGNLLSRRVTGKRPTGFTQRRQGCAKAAKKTDAARLGKRLQVRDPRNWLELGAARTWFAQRIAGATGTPPAGLRVRRACRRMLGGTRGSVGGLAVPVLREGVSERGSHLRLICDGAVATRRFLIRSATRTTRPRAKVPGTGAHSPFSQNGGE